MNISTLVLDTNDVLAAIAMLDGVRLPRRTLASWATNGLVVPSIEWRQVRRATRKYSLADLGRARLVVRLTRDLRMPLHVAREVLDALDASDTPLRDLLRPANARQAKTMEAVLRVSAGKWTAAVVQVGETDYVLGVGHGQAQGRFQFGGSDETFRIPLADVVKGFGKLKRARGAA